MDLDSLGLPSITESLKGKYSIYIPENLVKILSKFILNSRPQAQKASIGKTSASTLGFHVQTLKEITKIHKDEKKKGVYVQDDLT